MPNKANNHWQGKRRDQVEFSYKIVFVFGLITVSWICAYGLYEFAKWLF